MKLFLKDLARASEWSSKSFADLPWRINRCFYYTLVSEIMLQQTTVSTVKNRFENFVKSYPNLKKLANAEEDELLKMWQGLGYYNRARRLKAAAQVLVKFKQTQFDVKELIKISGIGDYTANALVAIGLNQEALALDVNLERVLYRYLGISYLKSSKLSSKEFLKSAIQDNLKRQIIEYRQLHETLMDVGRVFCQARKRDCLQCPMKMNCKTFKENKDFYQSVVVSKSSKVLKIQVVLARLVIVNNDKIMLVQRNAKQWLHGQWELPTYVMEGVVPEIQYQKLKIKLHGFENIESIKSTITKYQFENQVYRGMRLLKLFQAKSQYKWFSLKECGELALTSISKKIIYKT